jgi:lysophospholipase L1-like esterase
MPITAPAQAATGDGSPSDSNIVYVGRWDNSNLSNVKSYWSGAYFRVNFTGTTLSIKLAAASSIYVTIDNVTRYYANANGTVNLTSTPLASGTHSLRVAARSEYDTIQFQGLVLSSGASTQIPAARNRLIEFVGDSITAGCCALTNYVLDDYSWLTGEALNADHTQIAYSGICLQNASCGENSLGMSNQFFKLQTIRYLNSPAWDFNRYQPNQVVINLGTNDSVSDSVFQGTYTTFLQNVRAKYPNADIFVLRTFGGFRVAPTQAAVNARISAGDTKIRYVDTTGWVTPGTSDFSDSLHPSVSGHVKIANRLTSVLGVSPTPTPTVNPNGTVSINAGGSATGSFGADQYFSGGSTYTTTNTIDTSQAGSVPAAVFQSERYGAMTYTIPNRSGSQTVTLYFAETYVTAAGQRLFNVSINGSTVLSSFDIYASAGGQNRAIARTFNTTANASGQVVIQFIAGTQSPKINGITVAGGPTPTTPPPTTPPVTTPPATTPPATTPPPSSISINAGGSATGSFTADQYFSGGSTYTNTATIDMSQITSNPPPAAVFNTERYGGMTYTIPNLTAGSTYTVTLYFAETYVTAAGQRLFNVSVNGATVLSSFDIYASAGGQNRAIARTFSATASSSGQVVIQFIAGTQNPKINGITVAG